MVIDIQGVLSTSNNHTLTDPVVHSTGIVSKEYGMGDLGKVGIRGYFIAHKCNSLCKKLGYESVIEIFYCTEDESGEESSCFICIENLKGREVTKLAPCGHMMCYSCFAALPSKENCPLCRRVIELHYI